MSASRGWFLGTGGLTLDLGVHPLPPSEGTRAIFSSRALLSDFPPEPQRVGEAAPVALAAWGRPPPDSLDLWLLLQRSVSENSLVAMDFSGQTGRVIENPDEAQSAALEEGHAWRVRSRGVGAAAALQDCDCGCRQGVKGWGGGGGVQLSLVGSGGSQYPATPLPPVPCAPGRSSTGAGAPWPRHRTIPAADCGAAWLRH